MNKTIRVVVSVAFSVVFWGIARGTPLVTEPKLVFDFNNDCMQGWHNRVWVTNAVGVGAWSDLPPNTYGFDEWNKPVPNNGLIYPADTINSNGLFCSSSAFYPKLTQGRGSYLTLGCPYNLTSYLDSGTNTKWVRSPRFRITGSGDLTFHIIWGKKDAETEPTYDYLVEPVALAEKGWTGVCLTDCETGEFILKQKGLEVSGGKYQKCTFTAAQMQAAGVTPEKKYTLDLMTMRAGGASWIALDDVEIPGVLDDPDVGTLTYEFGLTSMQGWHNRVWDTAAEDGKGAWVDLDPDVSEMPTSINGGAIYPETAETATKVNSLFTVRVTHLYYPYDIHHCGGYLITKSINTGNNVKWARSPEFFIDDPMRDLKFSLMWGQLYGYMRPWESMVENVAFANTKEGWAGVLVRDAESGKFVANRRGSGTGNGPLEFRSIPSSELLALDPNHAYTLDVIVKTSGNGSFILVDNVSIPGHLVSAYLTSFSLNGESVKRITGEMEFTVPANTDVTQLAPEFTLGAGAVCDVASGTVRDFTTPQVYRVGLPDGTERSFRVTVSKMRDGLSVKNGLVCRLNAHSGVVCDADGQVLKWKPCAGESGVFVPTVPTNKPTRVTLATRNQQPCVHFAGPYADGGATGQGLVACGTKGLPTGGSARTVFVYGRYNYDDPNPQNHGWGGFIYGATPIDNKSTGYQNGTVFGLVASAVSAGNRYASQPLAIMGWGSGLDFRNDTAAVANRWFSQCVTLMPQDDGKVTLKHYLNGALQNTHANVAYDTGRSLMTLGSSIDEKSFQLMDACEVLIYDRVLTDDERAAVESYLRTAWHSTGLIVTVK